MEGHKPKELYKRKGRWRAVDILSVAFLLSLTFLTLIFRYRVPRWGLLITLYLTLTGVLLFLVYANRKHGRLFEIIHDFVFPVAVVFLIFDSLGGLVHHINPTDRDELLIKIDYYLFGIHPTVWLEGISRPWLTDILQAAYSTYYFLPIIYGIFLKLHNKRGELELSLFLIIFCFYLSFIGYILFPAIGPRFTLDHLQNTPYKTMGGIFLAEFIRNTIDAVEGIKRDAFPSGHSAVALVVLYLSYRFEKRIFLIYLPIVSALLISTVYLRYHYVVDVIAGILLTIVTIYFGERLYKRWERFRGD
ncbi:MAG: phosphatase PAP2 family protein [Nitrospirota bacterium]